MLKGEVVLRNAVSGAIETKFGDCWPWSTGFERSLTLTGDGHLMGTGNDQNNRIVGNSGNNLLSGMGGVDTLVGNEGNDIALISFKNRELI